MGVWGAAQALAFAAGRRVRHVGCSDLARLLFGSAQASATRRCSQSRRLLFLVAALQARLRVPPRRRSRNRRLPPHHCRGDAREPERDFRRRGGRRRPVRRHRRDTTWRDWAGRVLLLDRAGRIKPCGGAVPPRLIRDFDIPDAPAGRARDRGPDGVAVGQAKSTCRSPAPASSAWWTASISTSSCATAPRRQRGPSAATGTFKRIERDAHGVAVVRYAAAWLRA